MSKAISRRGEEVDFELLRMKDQLNSVPKTIDVVHRERFIDKRKRRSGSRKIKELLAEQQENKKLAQEKIKKQREQTSPETPEITKNVEVAEEAEKKVDVNEEQISTEAMDEDKPKRINRKVRG